MIAGLRRYKKFLIYGTWSALFNTGSYQLPALLLSFFFSPKIVGFYALGITVLSLPMSMVGGAISQVFFQKASEAHNRIGNLSQVVEEIFKRLVSLGIFPILLLTLIGKDIFIVAFGEPWAEAGVYMQILGLWIFFRFISSPLSTLFAVLEKQSYGLFFNGLLFCTLAASLIVGGTMDDARLALFLLGGTGVACYGFLSFWLISKAGASILQALCHIAKYSIYCSPMLIIIAFAKYSLGVQEIGLLLMALCSLIVYYSFLIRRDEKLRKPLSTIIQKFGFMK
jgi:O-antigen/teichoic acid export membrane protein